MDWSVCVLGESCLIDGLIMKQLQKLDFIDVVSSPIYRTDIVRKLKEYDLLLVNYEDIELPVIRELLITVSEQGKIILFNVNRKVSSKELLSWPHVMGIVYDDDTPMMLLRAIEEVVLHGRLWLSRQLLEQALLEGRRIGKKRICSVTEIRELRKAKQRIFLC
ncbi:hypothetical protein [Thaumasiovibrio sp. DFM-14]|uniref:hypothetical protein n=1 Tax=Thaumasiovibrio sp. DFM-14 TaxID=3384792 RepID=UPI00399FFE26